MFHHKSCVLLSSDACPHGPSYSESWEGQREGALLTVGVGDQPELFNKIQISHLHMDFFFLMEISVGSEQGEETKVQKTAKLKVLASKFKKEKSTVMATLKF